MLLAMYLGSADSSAYSFSSEFWIKSSKTKCKVFKTRQFIHCMSNRQYSEIKSVLILGKFLKITVFSCSLCKHLWMRHQHGNYPKVTAHIGYIITNLLCAYSCFFKSSTSLSSYFSSCWNISNKSWFVHHGMSFFHLVPLGIEFYF